MDKKAAKWRCKCAHFHFQCFVYWGDWTEVTEMQTDQELGNCCQSATPTRSEVKLQNLYKTMKDFSEEGSDSEETLTRDSTDEDGQQLDLDLEVEQVGAYLVISCKK